VRLEREHVIPQCLYPGSLKSSSLQQITVPACADCNRGWSDDEAHFRNVLVVSGEANSVATELWTTKIKRSFYQLDGRRRVSQLFEQLKPVIHENQQRWMIYPGNDDRVVRVIRKIVRGLSHYHEVESAIRDERVWADVLKFPIPPEWLESIRFHSCEKDVCQYWYDASEEGGISSIWLLTFFGRTTFLARVESNSLN